MNTSTTLNKNIMQPNISFTERQIRFVIGVTMIVVGLAVQPETMGLWSIMFLASVPFITMAITGWDPLYAVMGKSTYVAGEEDIQQRSWTCPNIGTIDRGVRLGAGLMLMFLLLTMNTMQVELVLALLAIPLTLTAITAWDPIYAALGINSFASKVDVEAAEPDASDQTLAACYQFPQRAPASTPYPHAA